ncbi:YegP family protein [Thermophagus sp. OGC60D27]|uniref:YegP family protein n=1 Tax=Thermophagus sp. OGC60D27 TaxID=3458415 RepID=UPI004037D49F
MGKYAMKTAKNGQFMFNLKADNGEIILTSETYTSKAGCENGINSVKENSSVDTRYERKVTNQQKPYFVLKASNGQIIGKSEYYSSNSAMENGIRSVKKNGPISSVVELN